MPLTGSDPEHDGEPQRRKPDLLRFLDVYAPGLMTTRQRDEWLADDGLFATVIVRTQGTRSDLLREVLLCLCGQDSDDFEVVVMLHDGDSEAQSAVNADVAQIRAVLPERVRVLNVHGGTRTRPIVAGVEVARGRYVVVLDDDDHVTADWISTFRGLWLGAPGMVLRAGGAVRETKRLGGGSSAVRVAAVAPDPRYTEPWSLDRHIVENRTPFHAFAFPVFAVRELGITLDEHLDVVEDWDFLLRVAGALGVAEDLRITSIYNRGETDASAQTVPSTVWRGSEAKIRHRHRNAPHLVASSSADSDRKRRPGFVTRNRVVRLRHSVAYVYATEGPRGVSRRIYDQGRRFFSRDR